MESKLETKVSPSFPERYLVEYELLYLGLIAETTGAVKSKVCVLGPLPAASVWASVPAIRSPMV